MRSALVGLVVVVATACGPAGVGDDSSTEGSDSSTGDGDGDGDDSTPETETGDSPTSSFATEDDMPPVACDSFMQDCPEGEKCVPYVSSGDTWDDTKCVPIMGDGAVGESCTYGGSADSTDDCDATSWCWDVDEQNTGTCLALCTGSADVPVCPSGSACTISGSGVISICIPNCDPVVQDCGPGSGCFWTGVQFQCTVTTGDIPVGQPCGFINDCAAGNSCVPTEVLPECEGSACCSLFCDLDVGDEPCTAALPGTACVAFFEAGDAPDGYENVGICIVPP